MPQINYEQRAVAFIDVLGFGALVKSSVNNDTDKEKLESLVGLLESAIHVLNAGVSSMVPDHLIPKHTYISDCIILSAPLHDVDDKNYSGLETVVMRSIQLTHKFLDAGYLLSGGIATGPVWHANGNIVGTAYQEAYQIEANGNNPCILLSDSATQLWRSGFGAGSRMCVLDKGALMVNGLHDFYVPDKSHGGAERTYNRYLNIVSNNITAGLAPSARSKWQWFELFLNSEISEAKKWLGV